jgi:hypothetical protein
VQGVVTASEPDRTYRSTVQLPGELPDHEYDVDDTEGGVYRLLVDSVAAAEIAYGANLFGEAPVFAHWLSPGWLDVFLLDGEAYEQYRQSRPFVASVAQPHVDSAGFTFDLPHLRTDWHIVFSNTSRLVNTQVLDAAVTLYWDADRGPGTRAFVPLGEKPAVSGMRP